MFSVGFINDRQPLRDGFSLYSPLSLPLPLPALPSLPSSDQTFMQWEKQQLQVILHFCCSSPPSRLFSERWLQISSLHKSRSPKPPPPPLLCRSSHIHPHVCPSVRPSVIHPSFRYSSINPFFKHIHQSSSHSTINLSIHS